MALTQQELIKINELRATIQRWYKENTLVVTCNLLVVGRILRNFGGLK